MRYVTRPMGLFAAAMLLVSGCAETQLGVQLAKSASRDNAQQRDARPLNNDATIAPEEFDAKGLTIWDGARTLQGVWIAHPLATRARRVRVVNTETGKIVEGAMFRRDPSLSGPSILVSSDAATGLGLRPGAPTQLRIVALRDPDAVPAAATDVETAALPSPTVAPAPAPSPVPSPAPLPVPNADPGTEPEPVAAPAPAFEPEPTPVATGQPLTPSLAPAAATVPADDAPARGPVTSPRPAPRPAQAAVATAAPASSAPGAQLPGGTYVQAGAFGVEPNARALVSKLQSRGQPAQYVQRVVNGTLLNIVMIGPLGSDSAVERAKAEAAAAGVSGARKVTL